MAEKKKPVRKKPLPRRTIAGVPTALGRPSKISKAIADELGALLRRGLTQTDACDAASLPRSTFYAWLAKAKDIREELPDPIPAARIKKLTVEELRLLDFLDVVTGARARAKGDALTAIRGAMFDDWRAAAWFLERSFPEEYGRRDHIAIDSDEVVQIRVVWPEELHASEVVIDTVEISPNGGEPA